ncbi:MAG TPA: ribbon-helix-helix protein, CopG family [Pyrinomonadaceae bacterium]|jgi:metal-responsive CopG/Arc/MetJ family transcriptional regulator
MKTAVTIPDNIIKRADKLAKRRKISRSKLFTEAIESYLDEYDEEEIIRRINEVCDKVDTSVDPVLLRMATLSLPKDEW